MEESTFTIAGEKITLALQGTKLSVSTGGAVLETECNHESSSADLYHTVLEDLKNGKLYVEDQYRLDITSCNVKEDEAVDGRDTTMTKVFTSFKDFIKWASDNRFDLY